MKRSDFAWILFVLRRFNAADTKGRSAVTGILSVLGIAFGVTVLIVILAVMNGFQRSFIDTILQVSSTAVPACLRKQKPQADFNHSMCFRKRKP